MNGIDISLQRNISQLKFEDLPALKVILQNIEFEFNDNSEATGVTICSIFDAMYSKMSVVGPTISQKKLTNYFDIINEANAKLYKDLGLLKIISSDDFINFYLNRNLFLTRIDQSQRGEKGRISESIIFYKDFSYLFRISDGLLSIKNIFSSNNKDYQLSKKTRINKFKFNEKYIEKYMKNIDNFIDTLNYLAQNLSANRHITNEQNMLDQKLLQNKSKIFYKNKSKI